MVVELYPVGDHLHDVLLRLETVTVDALLLQRSDDGLYHPVLLRAVRGDELLLQAIAAYQTVVVVTGEDQAIIRTQRERHERTTQCALAGDQRLLLGGGCRTLALPLRESCQPNNWRVWRSMPAPVSASRLVSFPVKQTFQK